MKGVFLDRGTFPPELGLKPPIGIDEWREYDQTTPEQRLERVKDCTLVVTNKVVMDADIIAQCPCLQCIAVTATGVNNVDLDACRRYGIVVFNTTGYADVAVAEHAVMLMLALQRNLKRYLEDASERGWCRSPFFHHPIASIGTLFEQTLAIVGRGALGQAVASRAEALGMRVLYAERPDAKTVRAGYTSFERALRDADVVSLHCPLTESTRHLINSNTLALMKPGSLLINTGRGPLVNEPDLLIALEQGHIGGAGLDVATREPPGPKDTIWALAEQPNVIVTPHIGWASQEAMRRLLNQIEAKLEAWLKGGTADTLV